MHLFFKEKFRSERDFYKKAKKELFQFADGSLKSFFAKITLLKGLRAKKQNRNFVSKLRFCFGADDGT